MLALTPFTRSSNFDLIEFTLIWLIITPLILLIESDSSSSLKCLNSTFRLLEGKLVESLSVVSLSDWFKVYLVYLIGLLLLLLYSTHHFWAHDFRNSNLPFLSNHTFRKIVN